MGSQCNFVQRSEIGWKRLKNEIDIVNSTGGISRYQMLKALDHAAYYSGDRLVDARTWNSCGNLLMRSGIMKGSKCDRCDTDTVSDELLLAGGRTDGKSRG